MGEEKISLGSRVREAVDQSGLSREAVAEKVEISPATLFRWMSDTSKPNRPALRRLADAIGVRVDWLETGHGPMQAPHAGDGGGTTEDATAPPIAEPHHAYQPVRLVRVPTLRATAGPSGYEVDVVGTTEIDPDEIRRRYHVQPDHLADYMVSGDSMVPTIWPGEIVHVALRNGEPLRDGAVYILYGPTGTMIKRLRLTARKVYITSDNPAYPAEELEGEEFEATYRVIARALDVNRRL